MTGSQHEILAVGLFFLLIIFLFTSPCSLLSIQNICLMLLRGMRPEGPGRGTRFLSQRTWAGGKVGQGLWRDPEQTISALKPGLQSSLAKVIVSHGAWMWLAGWLSWLGRLTAGTLINLWPWIRGQNDDRTQTSAVSGSSMHPGGWRLSCFTEQCIPRPTDAAFSRDRRFTGDYIKLVYS